MSKGRFGIHGGQYIPETLMNAVIELEEAYNHYKDDPEFNAELPPAMGGKTFSACTPMERSPENPTAWCWNSLITENYTSTIRGSAAKLAEILIRD